MADELTVTVVFDFDSSGTAFTVSVNDLSIDVAGTRGIHNRQIVGTAEEALLLGDAATGGYLFGINRHAVGSLDIRQGTGTTDMMRLKPGEPCLFRVHSDSAAPYINGTTDDVEFEYWLIEV